MKTSKIRIKFLGPLEDQPVVVCLACPPHRLPIVYSFDTLNRCISTFHDHELASRTRVRLSNMVVDLAMKYGVQKVYWTSEFDVMSESTQVLNHTLRNVPFSRHQDLRSIFKVIRVGEVPHREQLREAARERLQRIEALKGLPTLV